ncbi:hypothetical protein [Nocardioides zhouii]|uniref:Lipoprotein n=1 Tax=Nocardioides zhouii TaxID=1168729 RepID=A0A4Q2SNR1_9ACTN|nr:hypothetical protein [Nocardioides zhouii]RYC05854.1 hypothetical protein EUA94_16480 [Nocardioides zhouii]
MHVRRALALAVVGPLLLAGCTGDPEPTPKIPDPTTSSSSPSPTDSETPEAESAEEFIRRWAAIEAEMENTGKTADYRGLSSGCKACTDLADLVEGWYAAGGFINWDGWRIQSVKPRGDSGNEFVVKVRSSPTRYKESKSGPLKTFDGGPGAHLLVLESQGASWVVTRKAEVPR